MTEILWKDRAEIAEARIKVLETEYLRENKVLQAIEVLEMMLGDGVDSSTATKKELDTFAVEVYLLAHSAQRGICFNSHDKERKKADVILADASKHGVSEYRNPLEPDPNEALIRKVGKKLGAKSCGP